MQVESTKKSPGTFSGTRFLGLAMAQPPSPSFYPSREIPGSLRADAGARDDDGDVEGHDGDQNGFMASLFVMMYTPNGFRVVCECPQQTGRCVTPPAT